MAQVDVDLISAPVRDVVSVSSRSLVVDASDRLDGDRWQDLIDNLIEWAIRPEESEDDCLPPSGETIAIAAKVMRELVKSRAPSPQRVVLDANGGIVFESRDGDVFESIHIHSDQDPEYCLFEGGKLRKRERWSI